MKNRYGDTYCFEKVSENIYTIKGDLKYWRYGGREGQAELDFSDLGFVDPSGGPFIEIGMKIDGRKVKKISVVANDDIYFEVE